jgi:hypothetical protein
VPLNLEEDASRLRGPLGFTFCRDKVNAGAGFRGFVRYLNKPLVITPTAHLCSSFSFGPSKSTKISLSFTF